MPLDRFRAALPGAAAIVSGGWRYGPVLEEAESLRAILTVSGGWPPELDYARCFERKIRVLSAAPGFAGAVAEMALGLALACTRDICAGDRAMRAGEETWLSAADGLDTFLLSGKRVGFVGFGNIGRRLRDLLEPFGCEVLAYDPWLTDAYLVEERVVPTPLDELLAGSRVIFVLATPTSENQALLSRALPRARRAGRRARAREPRPRRRLRGADRARPGRAIPRRDRRLSRRAVRREHPIRTAPGVVLSPHRAGLVQEALWELGRMVVDDLEAIARGLPPRRMQAAEPELATRYVRTTRTRLVQRTA